MKIYTIGVGHRARNGKDTVANFIKELRPNVHIFHWADALYDEVRNKERKYPLITKVNSQYCFLNSEYYSVLDFPYLTQIFNDRNITEYWGMDEKDSPMLQFWGTNYRRRFSKDYWVNKTCDDILSVMRKSNEDLYICIPDTRFLNEVFKIRESGLLNSASSVGKYIKVIRLNEDGTQFLDPSRDPNHPSECELEGFPSDYTIIAKSGELESIKLQTEKVLTEIEKKW